MVIAIDGFSATGKSSVSREVASVLGFVHIDTGALYRGITLFALENCQKTDSSIDYQALIQNLPKIHLEFRGNQPPLELFLNGTNVEKKIRSPEVSSLVSEVAALPEVRSFLLEMQRYLGEKNSVVMDGRDVGTTIFPNADWKFFMTAEPAERARRRWLELQELGTPQTFESVLENVLKRDAIDTSRTDSPLKPADDAVQIDTTHISQAETVSKIVNYVKSKS